MSSISISQINYVLALAETGSFSKAAEQCYVTQSTLSTMVKKLENHLDLRMFDRSSKPIRLTQEGHVIMEQLRVIYQEYDNLKELIQETKEEFYGTLQIGIIPTVAPFLLPLFLNRMTSDHPQVTFSIHEITTNDIITKVKSRELDIGILSLPISDKELNQRVLYHEDFLIYDATRKSSTGKRYKIQDIDVNRLWLLEESHCMTSQIEKICHLREKREVTHNLEYRSGSILSLLELVRINKGITLLPRLATRRKQLLNPKFICEIEKPLPVRQIGLITHSNFVKKRLLDMLEKEIISSTKPFLSTLKKVRVIKPF